MIKIIAAVLLVPIAGLGALLLFCELWSRLHDKYGMYKCSGGQCEKIRIRKFECCHRVDYFPPERRKPK